MPLFQKLVKFDTVINGLKDTPIIVNDLIDQSEENKEHIKSLIYTKYSPDMLTMLPSCDCGKTKGEYNLGSTCPFCDTVVKSVAEEVIEPLVWFRRPEGVEKLINPMVLTMLGARFKKSGFEIIKWLCDTTYKTHVKQPPVLNIILSQGVVRGYNNFVTNFDSIMALLFSLRDFKLKKNQRDYLKELLEVERDAIFSDYIPLPNKSLLIIEKTNVGIYIDPTIIGAIDAIEIITGIDSVMFEHSLRVKENRTIKAISKLSEFYEDYYKANFSGKPGIIRKHIIGSRSHFSFRAVASSITDHHAYDEIYISWGVAITVLREHLINKLLKRGYTYNSAIGLLYAHVDNYNEMLNEIFNELLLETGTGGFVCLIQRNPSLAHGSAQRVRISRVKTNVNDPTVSLSILIVKALNADFDGEHKRCL